MMNLVRLQFRYNLRPLTPDFLCFPSEEGGGGIEENSLKCLHNHWLFVMLYHRLGVACERVST